MAICVECGFSYHHGATHVDEKRNDNHREHGGDTMAKYDLVDREADSHAVALVDLDTGEVLLEPTSEAQHADGAAMPHAEEVRNR